MINELYGILIGNPTYTLPITLRIALSASLVILLTLIYSPSFIRFLRSKKLGQPIRSLGPESHMSKSGTPVMGGIIILISVVFATLLFADLNNPYIHLLWVAAVGFGFIGFIDDFRKLIKKNSAGLPGRWKLLFQLIVSTVIVLFLYLYKDYGAFYIPILDVPLIDDLGVLFIPMGIILITGTSNAVNLTDGLDGLAIGLSTIMAASFTVIAYVSSHSTIADHLGIPYIGGAGEISIFLGCLVGAGIGFLWFNGHPASVFMGDTGSLALGGILGTAALVLQKEFLLIIIGGVFIAELLSVVLQVLYFKLTKGKRLFKMTPLHHHFELSGWHEAKITIRFWIIGIVLALLGLATL
jgi:phospho-N-acetylmuramoyl-pentapeptide-transferase